MVIFGLNNQSDGRVRCNYACPKFLWMAPVVICGGNTMRGHR